MPELWNSIMYRIVLLIVLALAGIQALNGQTITLPSQAQKPDPCSWGQWRKFARIGYGERRRYPLPLLEAVDTGNLKQVRHLLSKNINVNAQGEDGESALSLAAAFPDLKMVKLLLNAGANPNLRTPSGETPLMRASRTKCTDVLKLLLDNNAWVVSATITGKTALLNAVENDNLAGATLLVNAGADIYAQDSERHSVIFFAIKARNLALVEYFFSLDKEKRFQKAVDDFLLEGVKVGKTEIIKFMLDSGASPNGKTESPGQPLGFAVQMDNLDTVDLLLARGADPNAIKKGRRAIITYAASYGNPEIIRKLIEAKAIVNPEKQNWSPLTEAARGNHVEAMKILIKAGANVNAQAQDGWTVLMMAVSYGKERPEAVRMLIDNGADVNLRDKYDEKVSALVIARAVGIPKIIQILLDAGAVE